MELWPVLWLFVALKVPLLGALWIIWWAVRQEPTAADEDPGDGGSRREPDHPRPRRPGPSRRGPHAARPPGSPRRVRAGSRSLARHGRQLARR